MTALWRKVVCAVIGHTEGPRDDGWTSLVVVRLVGLDGQVRERETLGTTYLIRCSRCEKSLRGDLVLHDTGQGYQTPVGEA